MLAARTHSKVNAGFPPETSHMLTFQSPLRGCAAAAAACLAGLLIMTLVTGANQQAFEILRAPADYASALAHVGASMRNVIALDDVFIAFYVTLTILLVR